MLVTDYVREQQLEKDTTADLLEVGVRYILMPLMVLAVGVGAGLSEDSPDALFTAAFQYAF